MYYFTFCLFKLCLFQAMTYTVKFNKVENPRKEKKDDDVDGPVVERKCPKCGHEKMSYAAVQLRYISVAYLAYSLLLRFLNN